MDNSQVKLGHCGIRSQFHNKETHNKVFSPNTNHTTSSIPLTHGGGASLYAPWRRCTPRWFRDLVATTTRQELQKNQCFLSWMCPPGYWDALPDKSWDSRRTWWGWNGVGVWSATAEGTEQWVIEIEWDWMEISGGVEQQHELMQFNILLPF